MKYIYGLVDAARCWFNEYIKTMNLVAGFKQYKDDTCILYRVIELVTVIILLDDTLETGLKPSFMDKIQCINT